MVGHGHHDGGGVQIVAYPMLDGEVIHRATIRPAPR